MKTRQIPFITCILLTVLIGTVTSGSSATMRALTEHFSVKEYNEFHDVLHPLQHDALPKKDFKTIRDRAGELTMRGDAIVKLGVPAGVTDVAEFEKELKSFNDALVKYKTDAAGTSDAKLEESYVAVHDSFEMLASMLPRKSKAKG